MLVINNNNDDINNNIIIITIYIYIKEEIKKAQKTFAHTLTC